jgi:hypothetical protein
LKKFLTSILLKKRGNANIINMDNLSLVKDDKFTEDDNNVLNCLICLESIDKKDDNKYYFNCQHNNYDYDCIKLWYNENSTNTQQKILNVLFADLV